MFKIGDKVRVKDLRGKIGEKAKSGCYLSKEVSEFSNKEYEICKIDEDGDMRFLGTDYWWFAEEWVEHVPKAIKVINHLDELHGLYNDSGSCIFIGSGNLEIRYEGRSVFWKSLNEINSNHVKFLKSIGFNFEMKEKRSREEIQQIIQEKYKNNKFDKENQYCISYMVPNDIYVSIRHKSPIVGAIYMTEEEAEYHVEELNNAL